MRPSALARLMASTSLNPLSGCWEWLGCQDGKGYGMLWYKGKSARAHVVSYAEHVGPVPDGLVLDHLCRVRHCVNPSHLEPVTHRENILRGQAPAAINARKAICNQGHALPTEGRKRACKICASAKASAWNKAHPERRKRKTTNEALPK